MPSGLNEFGQSIKFETSPVFLEQLAAALAIHVQSLKSPPDGFVRADIGINKEPGSVTLTLVWTCAAVAAKCHQAGLVTLPSFIDLSRTYRVMAIAFLT
jgi:hypothetical protein